MFYEKLCIGFLYDFDLAIRSIEGDFLQEKRLLEPGDIIVSVSDGVVDSKRDMVNKEYWVSTFLKRIDIDEPQIIAEELLNKTIENYNNVIKILFWRVVCIREFEI